MNEIEDIDEKPIRVALYLRVSTDEQAEKFGLDAQRSAVEALVKSKGKLKDGREAVVLAGKAYEYIDDGVSGTTELNERPAFIRLKEDVLNALPGQRPFDMVAVYKIDRFARKLRILLDVLKFFEQYRIEFTSATESIDTSTPFGRAMLGIMGVIAELELETIHERTTRGKKQASEQGVAMGANAPYGYLKDKDKRLVIFPDEAKYVQKIFDMFTAGKLSPQLIADQLTQDEVLTPDASAVRNGKRKGTSRKKNEPYFWRAERVRDILKDEVYIGKLYSNKTHKGKVVPKNQWRLSPVPHEPIILNHIFQFAQVGLKKLADRKELTKKKQEGYLYLLSGLLKCDYCRKIVKPVESEMMSWTGGKKEIKESSKFTYHYHCNRKNTKKHSITCPTVPIPAEPLEDYIIDFIRQLLSDPKAVYEYQKQLKSTQASIKHYETDKTNFLNLLEGLPQRKKSLLFQHEIGEINNDTLKVKLEELQTKEKQYKEKLNEIDFQLSQITLSRGYEVSLPLYAEKYKKVLDQSFKDRKELYELIHMLIDQIVVTSRPRQERDVIAGRKKENQMIPERIDIYLNLPQDLLRELYTHKFGVKSDSL